jgi:transcriptional regulator GlxA family with amidase domain
VSECIVSEPSPKCRINVLADILGLRLTFKKETGDMNPKRIGFLGFDGMTALDLVGPAEAFTIAAINEDKGELRRCYEVLTIGLTSQPFVAESGIVLHPHKTLRTAPALDTLVIPGGSGLRRTETNAKVTAWVKSCAGQIRRIATVCTGIYGLAPTGLLDGRNVTTHWRFARDVAQRFPNLKVDPNALFLKDACFYTSAGITAGIDLSLALIEEDYGPSVALAVARELVVYLKRSGGQEQYSEPLRFQVQSTDRFADLATWMLAHLDQDLSVEVLAERTRMCPRHFSRQFKRAFRSTPAAFIEDLRLDEARRRLALSGVNIESVASSVGFHSGDAFRRAFERRFNLTPSSYRSRFASHSKALLNQNNRGR